jgi:hypothetical protein
MANEDTKKEEWMYDFAWRSRDITQNANDRLDSKAMNLINFAGVLIPITVGVLFFGIEKTPLIKGIHSLFLAIILLIISIFFAFLVVWSRNQGGIDINKHFDKCPEGIHDIYGLTARRIGNWQEKIKKVSIIKNNWFLRASVVFILALFMIIHGTYLVLFS